MVGLTEGGGLAAAGGHPGRIGGEVVPVRRTHGPQHRAQLRCQSRALREKSFRAARSCRSARSRRSRGGGLGVEAEAAATRRGRGQEPPEQYPASRGERSSARLGKPDALARRAWPAVAASALSRQSTGRRNQAVGAAADGARSSPGE